MDKNITAPLAKMVDEHITSLGLRKNWVAENMGIPYTNFQRSMRKKHFTVDDANRILNSLGYEISYQITPIEKDK